MIFDRLYARLYAHRNSTREDSIRRHCLEKGDEEGKSGDYVADEALSGDSRGHGSTSTPTAPTATTAECEVELDDICHTLEAILNPLWGRGVEGVSITPKILRPGGTVFMSPT